MDPNTNESPVEASAPSPYQTYYYDPDTRTPAAQIGEVLGNHDVANHVQSGNDAVALDGGSDEID